MKLHSIKSLSLMASLIASTAAVGSEVELQNGSTVSMSRYGQSWTSTGFTVAVDNLGADKAVSLHQEQSDGSWADVPLFYSGTAGSKERWSISGNEVGTGEFVVKYEVNGQTYWDNNGGENYEFAADGQILGDTVTVRKTSHFVSDYVNPTTGKQRVNASVTVANIAYNKEIKLVYTTDDWATSTVEQMQFAGSRIQVGYGSYANPSANGTEVWNVGFDVDPGFDGEFFIEYIADGVSYYDNNFGDNYEFKLDGTYDAVHFRRSPNWGNGQPMTLINDNVWMVDFLLGENGTIDFKFDIYNDWTLNFGDSNDDGIAEQGGSNISVSGAGQYRLFFNDVSNEYWLQKN